jgi:hypothetical protein
MKGLKLFSQDVLPLLDTNIVLIVGQFHVGVVRDLLLLEVEKAILSSPNIVKVFAHNIDHYFHSEHWEHPKLAPWPFGLQHTPYVPDLPDPIAYFQKAFWKHLNDSNSSNNNRNKTKGIMHSYLSLHTNPEGRKNIPSGRRKLNYTEYYDEIAEHRFLLSPNGDRSETYRIYEALGLGTIPITGLPSKLYHHLKDGPVLFNTTDWYLDDHEASRRLDAEPSSSVSNRNNNNNNNSSSSSSTVMVVGNRIMVLVEFWLEYVERHVEGGSRNLRWFDPLQAKQVSLDDFYRKQTLTNNNHSNQKDPFVLLE